MKIIKLLKVKELQKEEIDRGRVRINIDTRNNIKRGSLIEIKCKNKNNNYSKPIKRLVYGHNTYRAIYMDIHTRQEIGLDGKKSVNNEYEFEIKPVNNLFKILDFNWNHPEYPLRFSVRLAIILTIISILISLFPYIVQSIQFILSLLK